MGKSQTPGPEKPVVSECEPSWLAIRVLWYLAKQTNLVSGFSWTGLFLALTLAGSWKTTAQRQRTTEEYPKPLKAKISAFSQLLVLFLAMGLLIPWQLTSLTSLLCQLWLSTHWAPSSGSWTHGLTASISTQFTTVHQKIHFLWLCFMPDPIPRSLVSKYTN